MNLLWYKFSSILTSNIALNCSKHNRLIKILYYLPMERMKLTEKEKDQILKRWAEAMSKIIERMSIEMGELDQENKKLNEYKRRLNQGNDDFKEQNKKLKEDNRFLTKISKEYMEKENIIEVTEFTQLYKDELEEENKRLKELVNEIHRDKEHILWEKLILQEENEKLKSDLAFERTMLDNVRAEYKSSQNVIKKLKEELKKYKKLHKYSNWELLTYSGD